jgi:hypothetical protein
MTTVVAQVQGSALELQLRSRSPLGSGRNVSAGTPQLLEFARRNFDAAQIAERFEDMLRSTLR